MSAMISQVNNNHTILLMTIWLELIGNNLKHSSLTIKLTFIWPLATNIYYNTDNKM